MADNLSEKKYPRLALPVGKIKIPKFLYISLIILIALILVVGGMYFYLKSSKDNLEISLNNKSGGKSSSDYIKAIPSGSLKSKVLNSVTGVSDLEITQKTLDWIDLQKNENGIYSIGCECVSQNCEKCADKIYIPRNTPFVLWSKFKYAQKIGNYDDFIKEVNLSQESIKEHSLQYYGWNCKLLYEPWQTDKLRQITKTQINNFCIKSEYEFEDGLKLPLDLDQTLLISVDKIMNNQSLSKINSVFDLKESFYNNAFLVSEIVIRKLWEETQAVLYSESNLSESDLAKIYFNKALVGYSMKENLEIKDSAILGIASVDMYRLTKDEKYLKFAEYLLNLKLELGEDIPYSLIYKALLAQDLTIITQNQSYNVIREKAISGIVGNNEESEYQKGAFKAPSDAYYLKENSLIVGLLSTL